MEGRFDKLDRRIDDLELSTNERFDALTNLIDGYAAKLDTYAQEMAAMQHKIDRLEKYIQILADKAGVDLDAIHV